MRIATQGWRPAAAALSLLGVATALGAVMVFLAQLLLARRLGPSEYGLFASSLATAAMLAPLAGFGLSQFRLKVYGTEGWGADRWLRPSLRFAAITTSVAIAGVVAWALFGPPVDGDTRIILLVLTAVIPGLLAIEVVGSKLRLEDRYGALAAWQLLMPGGRLAVAALVWSLPAMAAGAAALGYGLVALAAVALAVPQLRVMLRGEMKLRGHGARQPIAAAPAPRLSQLFSQAWPYGMAALLYPVFFQIGTVLLKYLGSDALAGRFGVALAILSAIYLFPATVYQKFLLSKLHRWAAHDRPKFWRVHRQGNFAMLVCGIVLATALALLAPHVTLVFGPQYREVSPLLMVLALCVPLRFLSTSIGSALLTEGHMRFRVAAMAAAALAAVALNVALIPRYQEMGAATATVAAELLLLGAMAAGVRRMTSREPAQ